MASANGLRWCSKCRDREDQSQKVYNDEVDGLWFVTLIISIQEDKGEQMRIGVSKPYILLLGTSRLAISTLNNVQLSYYINCLSFLEKLTCSNNVWGAREQQPTSTCL